MQNRITYEKMSDFEHFTKRIESLHKRIDILSSQLWFAYTIAVIAILFGLISITGLFIKQ